MGEWAVSGMSLLIPYCLGKVEYLGYFRGPLKDVSLSFLLLFLFLVLFSSLC